MSRTTPVIKIREATCPDIPKLVERNRAAYPVLANGEIIAAESLSG